MCVCVFYTAFIAISVEGVLRVPEGNWAPSEAARVQTRELSRCTCGCGFLAFTEALITTLQKRGSLQSGIDHSRAQTPV